MIEKEDLMKRIGNNVRKYRMARNLTQEQLSVLVGKNPSAITRIEGGQRMMSVSLLYAISSALGVSVDSLLIENKDRSVYEQNILKLLSDQSVQLLGTSPPYGAIVLEEVFVTTRTDALPF